MNDFAGYGRGDLGHTCGTQVVRKRPKADEREGNFMTAAPAQIVIRHLSGSKSNQIDQFDLAGLQEITFGRDPSSKVVYDLRRDDEVSRKHAVIRINNDKELYFRISDLNSSNGTLLNGERIGGEVELLPNDVVELGAGGPKFMFDVQPRPANLPARTRQMGELDAAVTRMVDASAEAGATLEHAAIADTQQRAPAAGSTSALTRAPVGKATIMRMLSDERVKSRQVWIAALAAVLVLAIIGGGAIFWHDQKVARQLETQLAAEAARAEQINNDNKQAIEKTIGLTPAAIRRLGDATVYIHNQWQLYDRETNRPVYQKMVNVGGEWLPCYVRMDDGKLVRYLTLENDKDSFYKPIGKDHSGSGFVIGDQGFILTNKHVAAGWSSEYEDFSYYNWTRGAVYYAAKPIDRRVTEKNVNKVRALTDWVPESGGYLFESKRPNLLSSGPREFFGRNEVLTVQFPGTRININANLLRTSIDADVAEIKVDSSQSVSKLELADDNSVQIGQKIILLGYPGVSQETIAVQQSSEGGTFRSRTVYIPEPTVTQGIVAKMPTKTNKRDDNVTTFGTTGDTYQLDIFAGPGHSGGPVLNSDGKVIALLSLVSTTAQHVSFAVPVSYVRELLQPQRNASP
jgi:S1-C subfamily serine protease